MPYKNPLEIFNTEGWLQIDAAFQGRHKRLDCVNRFRNTTYDISLYRTTDTMVRVDVKLPKQENVKNGKKKSR